MTEASYYHKLFRLAIVKESVYDTYEEAIEEFSEIHGVELGRDNSCICTHPISENCFVKSKVNGKILVIGNKCIENFFPEAIKTKVNKLFNAEKRKTRDCLKCCKRFPKENDFEFCRKCRRANWKKCIGNSGDCKLIVYADFPWKVRCIPCWRGSRSSSSRSRSLSNLKEPSRFCK